MNWKNYEDIVKSIYEQLGANSGVKIVCHGHDCKVRGKSGVEHQVDVLAEHSDGLHTYRTAIECKYWDKRRPKDDVMKLAEILEDAKLHKGVIVSKEGFTEDAVAFATCKNIELVELRKPTEEDWKGRLKDIHLNITITIPHLSDFTLHIVDTSDTGEAKLSQSLDPASVLVNEPDQAPQSLHAIIQSMLSKADCTSTEPQQLQRAFAAGTTANNVFGRPTAMVAGLQFKVVFEHSTEQRVLKGEDAVAMIMKSHFDNRRFVVSPEGTVRESEA